MYLPYILFGTLVFYGIAWLVGIHQQSVLIGVIAGSIVATAACLIIVTVQVTYQALKARSVRSQSDDVNSSQ